MNGIYTKDGSVYRQRKRVLEYNFEPEKCRAASQMVIHLNKMKMQTFPLRKQQHENFHQ